MMTGGERIQIKCREQLTNWSHDNHRREEGVWFVTSKRHVEGKCVSRHQVVKEAICCGWVDSKPPKLDDDRTMLWLAPRKPGSGWSKINKDRVERMIESGQMTAAGLVKSRGGQAGRYVERAARRKGLGDPNRSRIRTVHVQCCPEQLRSIPSLVQAREPRVDRERQAT